MFEIMALIYADMGLRWFVGGLMAIAWIHIIKTLNLCYRGD